MQTGPRRFAPLKRTPGQQQTNLPKLQGVIFDVDGTLCLPQNYMFTEMRNVLGIPKSIDILTHIASLPTAAERDEAMGAIQAIERAAMASQEAQPGLSTLMTYLQEQGVRKAICTRNFEQPVTHLLRKFLVGVEFSPIVTRDFRPPKPDPAGLLFIARSWGLVRDVDDAAGAPAAQAPEPERRGARGPRKEPAGNDKSVDVVEEVGDASALIMVGDSIDDMTAGRRAGAATVLLVNSDNAYLTEHPHTDLVIRRLDDLVGVLDAGFVGRDVPVASN
ncbi:HAD-like protein [Xylaria telfairii]|nr:HAD-like protein [Xylaria telfairii]